jgi:hypothetical protein
VAGRARSSGDKRHAPGSVRRSCLGCGASRGHRALDQLSYRTRISVQRLAEIEQAQVDNYSKPTRRRETHGVVYGGLLSR